MISIMVESRNTTLTNTGPGLINAPTSIRISSKTNEINQESSIE